MAGTRPKGKPYATATPVRAACPVVRMPSQGTDGDPAHATGICAGNQGFGGHGKPAGGLVALVP